MSQILNLSPLLNFDSLKSLNEDTDGVEAKWNQRGDAEKAFISRACDVKIRWSYSLNTNTEDRSIQKAKRNNKVVENKSEKRNQFKLFLLLLIPSHPITYF